MRKGGKENSEYIFAVSFRLLLCPYIYVRLDCKAVCCRVVMDMNPIYGPHEAYSGGSWQSVRRD